MEKPSCLFDSFSGDVQAWMEYPDEVDIFSVQNLLRKGQRVNDAITDDKIKINSVGSLTNNDTSGLELLEDQLNEFRVKLERRESILQEVLMEKREIASFDCEPENEVSYMEGRNPDGISSLGETYFRKF